MASLEPHSPTWIGPCWAERGWKGVRLLVLAEKFPARSRGLNVGTGLDAELVGNYVDGSLKHRQFTDVARLALGEAKPRSECEAFWNSVALSNVLPHGSRSTSRSEPSTQDWEFARTETRRLLNELRPTAVLVLGTRLAEQIQAVFDNETISSELKERVAYAPHPGIPGFAFREHTQKIQTIREKS